MVESFTTIRRVRCGDLEAVIVRTPPAYGQTRYGVFFRRIPKQGNGQSFPFFDFGELLTLAKLARLSHANLMDLLLLEESDG